jgi:hypothetical protein
LPKLVHLGSFICMNRSKHMFLSGHMSKWVKLMVFAYNNLKLFYCPFYSLNFVSSTLNLWHWSTHNYVLLNVKFILFIVKYQLYSMKLPYCFIDLFLKSPWK